MDGKQNTTGAPRSELDEGEKAATFWAGLRPVVFLVVIFFLNFIGRIIISPLLPTIERELGISHAQAGALFFFVSIGYLLGLLGSGFFASWATHKLTIVVSSAGVGFALLGVSLATTPWTIRSGLLGLGLAAGLYMPSAIATITSLIPRQHWGKTIAIHELAPNLAFFFGPFVAEMFLRWSTWRMALMVIGLAALVASFAYRRLGKGGEFLGESPASHAFTTLVQTPAFWLMLLLFGLGISSTIGVYAMLPLYLVSERHLDPSWTNTIVALSRSHGPILGMLGGWVSDRLGPKRTMVASLAFTGIATLLLGAVPTAWIGVNVFLQPLLAVCFFPAGFAALAAITPPAARNLAVAFAVPFGYLIGGGAIPTFIGIMGDIGSFAAGFMATGALIFSAGVLALLLKQPPSTEKEDVR